MDALTKDKPFTTLQDVVDVLNEFPEVRGALQDPAIRVGEPGSYAGKVCVLFAGVTGGGAQVYNTFFDYGVGTLIVMHMPEDDIKAVAEHNKGNVIIAGHMASDSIGFNRVLDAWQAEGLEVTRIGGLVSSRRLLKKRFDALEACGGSRCGGRPRRSKRGEEDFEWMRGGSGRCARSSRSQRRLPFSTSLTKTAAPASPGRQWNGFMKIRRQWDPAW